MICLDRKRSVGLHEDFKGRQRGGEDVEIIKGGGRQLHTLWGQVSVCLGHIVPVQLIIRQKGRYNKSRPERLNGGRQCGLGSQACIGIRNTCSKGFRENL